YDQAVMEFGEASLADDGFAEPRQSCSGAAIANLSQAKLSVQAGADRAQFPCPSIFLLRKLEIAKIVINVTERFRDQGICGSKSSAPGERLERLLETSELSVHHAGKDPRLGKIRLQTAREFKAMQRALHGRFHQSQLEMRLGIVRHLPNLLETEFTIVKVLAMLGLWIDGESEVVNQKVGAAQPAAGFLNAYAYGFVHPADKIELRIA